MSTAEMIIYSHHLNLGFLCLCDRSLVMTKDKLAVFDCESPQYQGLQCGRNLKPCP